MFTPEFFRQNRLLVEWNDTGEPVVFTTSETSPEAIEEVRFLLKRDFGLQEISPDEFEEKIEFLFSEREEIRFEDQEAFEGRESLDLLNSFTEAPVVNLINKVLIKASRVGASDIHFEPAAREAIIKLRLDGILHEYQTIPMKVYPQVASRIKVMANLNVAERKIPQDGRMRIKIGDKELDIRVSVLPTVFGERVVLRLLDKSNQVLSLEDLGLESEALEHILAFIHRPYGIILATGPTGSGKSTTLYAMLLRLREIFPHKNIITIEDPVEYQISGLGQVQVNPKVGLTFATGLRSILRQDPDVILVGEIRDAETAEIAIHAALTGHLVLSTLHTNDSPSAVTRLKDMGIEPYLISSALEGVIAQRLVRKICPRCREAYKPSAEELVGLGLDPDFEGEFYRGTGCEECLGTGYRGRTAIFEILNLDEGLKEIIVRTQNALEIKKVAAERGFKTLLHDGLKKVFKGITTASEVMGAVERP